MGATVSYHDNADALILSRADPNRLVTDDIKAVMADTGSKFKAFAPHYKGSATPEDAVKDVLDTIRRASIERGYAGDAVSQFGNKQWL